MSLNTPTYNKTRQAWRNIWSDTDFARELATLDYPRARELRNLYAPYLDKELPSLEAGCGLGHIVYYFRQHGYPMLGLDYAQEALVPTHAAFPNLPLHLGDVHHLPYPENTFGAYLSFGVVEHFEAGPLGAIREAYRVLKRGGHLILTTPTPNFVEALRKIADTLIPARVSKRPPRAEYYETTYTAAQLRNFAQQADFEVVKTVPYGHSFTFYGLHRIFRKPRSYYETSPLGELAGRVGKFIAPYLSAFEVLLIARKP
ncbi:MAG: hypothetical protein OHK0023_20680 [Anaerolineae bacterium]